MKKPKILIVSVDCDQWPSWAVNSRGKKITWKNYDAFFNGFRVAEIRGYLIQNSGVKYDVMFMTTFGNNIPKVERTDIGINKAKRLVRETLQELESMSSGEYV